MTQKKYLLKVLSMSEGKVLGKICLLLAGLFLLVGCAPGKLAWSAYDRQVEVVLPTVEIDRYEPVVFPAGRLE